MRDSKTLRELEVGEVVRALDLAKEGMGLKRARCCALQDAKEAWVIIAKPYHCLEEEMTVAKDFESTSAEKKSCTVHGKSRFWNCSESSSWPRRTERSGGSQ